MSIDEAEANLVRMLSSMDKVRTRSVGKERVISSRYSSSEKVRTRSSSVDEKKIYVFNFEDNQGYAIMSADKRMPSLLALVDSGELKEGDVIDNPGLAHFLMAVSDEYDARMMGMGGEDDVNKPKDGVKIDWEYGERYEFPISGYDKSKIPERIVQKEEFIYHVSDGYEGTCKVKWGQGAPYNLWCPMKNGKRCVTGCVATAAAQLMSVFKYPKQLSDGTKIDWDRATAQPKIKLDKHGSDNYFNIHILMRELGEECNLDMDYDLSENGGSGTKTKYVTRTLGNYGYSVEGYTDFYSTDKLINELKQNRCCIVYGKTIVKNKPFKPLGFALWYYTGKDGHAWLADGLVEKKTIFKVNRYRKVDMHTGEEFKPRIPFIYEFEGYSPEDEKPIVEGVDFRFELVETTEEVRSQLMFHYNWGWNGYADGYFYANCFNPKWVIDELPRGVKFDEDKEVNFDIETCLVLGIKK